MLAVPRLRVALHVVRLFNEACQEPNHPLPARSSLPVIAEARFALSPLTLDVE